MGSLQIGRGSNFTYLILRSVSFPAYNVLNARQSLQKFDSEHSLYLVYFRLMVEESNDARLQVKLMKYYSIRAWRWNAYQS